MADKTIEGALIEATNLVAKYGLELDEWICLDCGTTGTDGAASAEHQCETTTQDERLLRLRAFLRGEF
jgi:hypothetical protein